MKRVFLALCLTAGICVTGAAHAGYYPDCSWDDWQMGMCVGYVEALQAQAAAKAEAEALYGESALSAGATTTVYWGGGAWNFGVIVTVTFGDGSSYSCESVWRISSANGTLTFDHVQCYGA